LNSAILLVDCPGRRGVVAAIADLLYAHGGNILHADQHPDNEAGMFLMRIEWPVEGFNLEEEEFRKSFVPIAGQFQMRWKLVWPGERLL
jgi:formyltetrahydrofolate deformylase